MKKISGDSKGHLAIRLNNGRILNTSDLAKLIEYCNGVFGVKYLTLISGNMGFKREIDLNELGSLRPFSILSNYQNVFTSAGREPEIYINLVNDDSKELFLLKVNETMLLNGSENEDVIYNKALSLFTNFPPIDLLLCMTHSLDFNRLFPLHLSFTQFYSCPVLADQLYSFEAISEGFERFSRTKQNFGR